MSKSQILNVADTSLNAVRENFKIYCYSILTIQMDNDWFLESHSYTDDSNVKDLQYG